VVTAPESGSVDTTRPKEEETACRLPPFVSRSLPLVCSLTNALPSHTLLPCQYRSTVRSTQAKLVGTRATSFLPFERTTFCPSPFQAKVLAGIGVNYTTLWYRQTSRSDIKTTSDGRIAGKQLHASVLLHRSYWSKLQLEEAPGGMHPRAWTCMSWHSSLPTPQLPHPGTLALAETWRTLSSSLRSSACPVSCVMWVWWYFANAEGKGGPRS
jgi:hypothetical protein